jgi:hypothetical protein
MSIVERRFKSNAGPFQFHVKESLVLELGTDGMVVKVPIVKKTANYTLTARDATVLVDTSAGAVTLTLPASPMDGQIHVIKKVTSNANALTVSGNGNLIDGQTSIGTGATVDLVSLRLHYGNGVWNGT